MDLSWTKDIVGVVGGEFSDTAYRLKDIIIELNPNEIRKIELGKSNVCLGSKTKYYETPRWFFFVKRVPYPDYIYCSLNVARVTFRDGKSTTYILEDWDVKED